MPRQRPGYTQLPFEMPDDLLTAVRAAAEEAGLKLTTWICATLAKKVGVEYTPPRLGRPPKEADEPAPKKRGKGK